MNGPRGDEGVTASSQRYERRITPAASFELHVVAGPDTGKSLVIRGDEPEPPLVGTSASCALRLSDREISRRHLALELEGERLRVTDLRSTNGTRVDGVQVTDAWVTGGEALSLGETVIRVATASSSPQCAPPARTSFGGFIGGSPELLRLYPLVARLAASEVSVVVEGETGTGKEVLAEAIHEHSPRASKPYVVLDCTTLPANLIEAELFGHERGAFTGSVGQRRGVFEQADGGTLFIDEIGDLDLSLQPKLLRVLERGEFRRIGGTQLIRVDVRVVAATRRDLDHEVEVGAFRDDLFHRLAVGRISLPPLRRRQGDVALLAAHFWQAFAPGEPLPARLLARWESYPWPGNVRELKNTIARQLATGGLELPPGEFGGALQSAQSMAPHGRPQQGAPSDPTQADGSRASEHSPARGASKNVGADAPPEIRAVMDRAERELSELLWSHTPFPIARVKAVEVLQNAHVERALIEHGGAIDAAASSMGIGRRYLHMLKAGPRKR